MKSNRIFWIPVLLFIFSLSVPVLFLSAGNSACNTSPDGLDQSGDTYIFTKQESAGCFIKGRESKLNFTVGSFSEKENTLIVFLAGNKIGEWKVAKGIWNVSLDSNQSISDLKFHFKDPIPKVGDILLFQKKTAEYGIYHNIIFVLLVVSLGIFIFRFKLLLEQAGSLFLILWLIFYSLSFLMLKTWPVSFIGDEPHYLLLGESLLEDRDLLLENQYEQNKESLIFRKFDHHTIFVEGMERPVHYPLLSIFVSLAFLNQNVGIQAEPQLVGRILMILIHSFGSALLTFFLLKKRKYTFEYFVIPVLIFGLPWIAYANQIFPEVVAGVLVFGFYILLTESKTFRFSYWLPVLFIMFPFLHIKLGFVSAIFLLYWMYLNKADWKRSILGGVLYSAGILLFLLYNYSIFRNISPYGQKDVLLNNITLHYLAYLFDSDRGILALNPILFFSVIGIFALLKKDFLQGIFLVTLLIVGHIPNVFHTNIWLGACPYGRYWVAIYPLIAYYSMDGVQSVFDLIHANAKERKMKKFAFYFVAIFLLSLSILQIFSFVAGPENYYTHFGKTMVAANFISSVVPIHLDTIYYSYFIPESKLRLSYWIGAFLLFSFSGFYIFKKSD